MRSVACLAVHQAGGLYGWAAVVQVGDDELILTGQQRHGSRSYLTLLALTRTLGSVSRLKATSCHLYVPSPIWVDKISRLPTWHARKWRMENRAPLKYAYMWKSIYPLTRKITFTVAVLRNCPSVHSHTVQLARRLARHNPIFEGGGAPR